MTLTTFLVLSTLPIIHYYIASKWAVLLHTFAGLTSLILVIAMIIYVQDSDEHSSTDPLDVGHKVVGYIYLSFASFNLLCGIYINLNRFKNLNLPYVLLVKYAHKIVGYIYVLLPFYLVVERWYQHGQKVAVIVTAVTFSLLLILQMAVVIIKKRSAQIITQIPSQNLPVSSLTAIKLQSTLTQNYFVFNDYVYFAHNQKIFDHPGGRAIIEAVMGRQIDRFIYGMYPLQTIKGGYPWKHSANCFQALDIKPSFKIPQVDTIRNISFKISSKTDIGGQAYSFHFQNGESRLPLTKLSQVGKYFLVYSDPSIKRLYTQVAFLHQQCVKKLPQDMIKGLPVTKDATGLNLLIKIYKEGAFTKVLNKFQLGSTIFIQGPKGRGLELQSSGQGQYIIAAAGTGVFPFLDLLFLIAIGCPQLKGYNFNMFLKFRGSGGFYLKQFIEKVAKRAPQKLKLHVYLQSVEEFSQIIINKMKDNLGKVVKVFVCGPPSFNQQIPQALKQKISYQKISLV